MTSVNRVKIMVDGKTFTLMGQESTEHIQKVATYIDEKMKEIRSSSTSITMDASLAYVLTSLNVGDDYFKALEERETLLARLKEAQEYLDEIDANWRKAEEKMLASQSRIQQSEKGLQEDYKALEKEYDQLRDKLSAEKNSNLQRINGLEKDVDRLQRENSALRDECKRLQEISVKKEQDNGVALEIQKMQELEIKSLREQLEESQGRIRKLEKSRQDCELRAKNLDKARLDAENRLDNYLMALEGGSFIGGAERGQNRVKNKRK